MKIRRSSSTKKIVITTLTLCGVALLVTPALSYWSIVEEQQYRHDEDISFEDYDEGATFYNVEFYRTVVEAGTIDEGTTTDYTISSSSDRDTFLDIISDYSIYIDYDNESQYKEVHTTGFLTDYYTYYYYPGTYESTDILVDGQGREQPRAVLEITTTVEYNTRTAERNQVWNGAYTLTVYSMSEASQVTETTSYGSMQVRSGEIITSRMFSTFLENMKEDYYFSSLIYTDSEFSDYFYLNETQVTSDLTLYVLFYQNSPSSMGISTLTSAMESNSGTLQASNAEDYSHFQIQDDPSYNSSTNTIYLGYGNKTAVAPSGSTLNLCLTDENVYTTMPYADSSSANYIVNENDSSKTCDYTVKLCGDIDIEGTMTIGGEIGSQYNAGVQSNINTHYVCLDLCGHTITINNGGALLSYGVIKDSIGNGEIIVHGGGKFETDFIVHDYRAGGATIGAYDFDVPPFFNYCLPYVQVPVTFEYDQNGWGELYVYFYFHPFGSGGTTMTQVELEINLLGSATECLFTLDTPKSDSDAYVLLTYSTSNVSSSLSDKETTYLYGYERHNTFRFYNVDMTINYFVINISVLYGIASVQMRTNQFDFPVSPFLSIFFYNSICRLNSRLCFLKGSSLYLDKDSSLILGYQTIQRGYFNIAMGSPTNENVDVSGRIFFMDVAMNSYDNDSDTIVKTDRLNVYTASQLDNYIYNNKAYFKYAQSSFKIDGTLLFLEGNTSSTPYSIAGRCDVKQVGVIDSDGNENYVNPLSSTDTSAYNPFTIIDYYETQESSDSSTNVYYQTYDFDGINGAYYYTSTDYRASACKDYMELRRGRSLPLISNGVAYSLSNIHNNAEDTSDSLYSPNIVGTYNDTLNLIESDGQYYFYYTGNADSSDSSNIVYPYLQDNSSRGYVYNHDTQLIECTYDTTNHLVKATISSSEYSFAYFSSCYLPYSSNTVNIQRLVSKYIPSSGGGNATLNVSVSWNSSYNSWCR